MCGLGDDAAMVELLCVDARTLDTQTGVVDLAKPTRPSQHLEINVEVWDDRGMRS